MGWARGRLILHLKAEAAMVGLQPDTQERLTRSCIVDVQNFSCGDTQISDVGDSSL